MTSVPQTRYPAWAAIIAAIALGACSSGPGASVATAPTSAPTAGPTATATEIAPTVTPTPAPTLLIVPAEVNAPASDVVVDLAAKLQHFSTAAISAPADKSWKLAFDQQEVVAAVGGYQITHNFTITTGNDATQRSFKSDNYSPGHVIIEIPGLPAGTYNFLCTIHAFTMNGTLTVH